MDSGDILWYITPYGNNAEGPTVDLFYVVAYSILMTLNIVNITLHSLGLYVLVLAYKIGQNSNQQLFLVNLSFAELFQNITRLVWYALTLSWRISRSPTVATISNYIIGINNTTAFYMTISALFLLTLDRLLSVLLGMRYRIHCTRGRTKTLLFSILIANLFIGLFIVLVIYLIGEVRIYGDIFIKIIFYIITTLFVLFVIFAISSYAIIFHAFVTSRRETSTPQASLFRIFRESHFINSLLLICNFLFLAVFPSLIVSFSSINHINLTRKFHFYVNISYTLSDTADGIIYIFASPSVRNILSRKVASLCTAIDNLVNSTNKVSNSPTGGISMVNPRSTYSEERRQAIEPAIHGRRAPHNTETQQIPKNPKDANEDHAKEIDCTECI